MGKPVTKVLLLDAYSSRTLACVRSFGKRSIPFAVGGHTRWDMALHSRYSRETFVYGSPYVSISCFLDDVNVAARRFGADIIFPTSEAAIMACTAHRDRLAIPLLAPTPEQIAVLFNKRRTLALAETANVPIPRTHLVDASGVDGLRDLEIPLPAIVKSNTSESQQGDRIGRGGQTVYVYSREELLAEARRKLARTPEILVQEFIDGYGVGVSGIFAKGAPVALFGHRRIRESTPTGGPSAVAVSIPVEGQYLEATRRIMAQTDYTGPAMVEYKVERRTGTPYLMEINCRFWGSVLLPLVTGLDLPYILWRTINGQEVTTQEKAYRVGVIGRYLVGDTKHLLLTLRGRPSRWTGAFPGRGQAVKDYVALFFSPDSRNLLLTRDDPGPFFARLLQEAFA